VVLDACLSILFVVGTVRRDYIAKHKRLSGYDEIDYDILSRLIANSSGVIFTPNVLSETSNLLRHIADPIRSQLAAGLAAIITNGVECFMESRVAVRRPEYIRLGLTDAVLLELIRGGATLLTIDLDLYLAALRANLLVLNYNHLKDRRQDFR
jgi:hypothetical protein